MRRASLSMSHAAIGFVVADELERDAPYEIRDRAKLVADEFRELAVRVFANTRADNRIDDFEPLWDEDVRRARLFLGGITDSR